MRGKEVMGEGVTSNDTTSRIADKIMDILNTHDIKSFTQLCAEDIVFDNPDLEPIRKALLLCTLSMHMQNVALQYNSQAFSPIL